MKLSMLKGNQSNMLSALLKAVASYFTPPTKMLVYFGSDNVDNPYEFNYLGTATPKEYTDEELWASLLETRARFDKVARCNLIVVSVLNGNPEDRYFKIIKDRWLDSKGKTFKSMVAVEKWHKEEREKYKHG